MSTLKRTVSRKTATKKSPMRAPTKAVPATSSAKGKAAPAVRKRTVPRAAAVAANPKVAKSGGAKPQAASSAGSALKALATPEVLDHAKQSAAVHWKRQSAQLTDREFSDLSALKDRIGGLGTRLKRGEILRVGLHLMSELSEEQLLALLERTALPRRG